MSGTTLEQLRIPVALVLIVVAAFIFLPRGQGGEASATPSPTPQLASVPTAGQPGGEVTSTATALAATPVPTVSAAPTATPEQSAEPTPEPVAEDGFSAEILACRSISGAECNGQLGTLPSAAGTFTALVRFTDATAGDVISVTLSGAGGTIAGGPYTLGGSGDGYYYSVFNVPGLPGGEYAVTAIRNGDEVADTTFELDD